MQELELAKNSAPAAAQKGSIPQGSVTMELKMLIDSVFIIYIKILGHSCIYTPHTWH